MANLTETATWETGIFRKELSTPATGGESGEANIQAKQLGNRTLYLKEKVEELADGTGIEDGVITRPKLKNGVLPTYVRNCILSGPVTSSGGPANVTVTLGTPSFALDGSPTPIRMSFASGYDDKGQVDYIAKWDVDSSHNLNTTGVPMNATDVYVFAELNPNTGVVTIGAEQVSNVKYNLGEPAGGGIWWQASQGRWLGWSPDFSSWSIPRHIVILARFTRDSSGNITGVVQQNFRESLENPSPTPVGTVVAMYRELTNPPAGYVACNGASLQRAAYPVLGALISPGTSTAFTVPDLRGQFIRGLDAGAGIDVGRVLGSSQDGKVGDHKHEMPVTLALGQVQMQGSPAYGTGGNLSMNYNNSGAQSQTAQNNPTALTNTPLASTNVGAGDNRPTNVALGYFIKF